MMARFAAIVRVGPAVLSPGPLRHWHMGRLSRWQCGAECSISRMLHAAATTAVLYASNACPLKARRARQPSGVGRLGAAGLADPDVVGILVRMAARLA